MLVKFSTRHGQLIMQGEPAVALIRLGGHSGTVPSAVLARDVPAFLDRLRGGLEAHGDEMSPAPESPPDRAQAEIDGDEPRERPVRLRTRAVPLLEMLDTAVERESDLMWERA
jgi:hypothetical protein